MLKHYFVTVFRNFKRNKLFTAINVVGLSVGIAVFLALTGYVNYQFSFDKFYPDGNRIYRIDYFEYQEGVPVLQSARTHDRTALLASSYVPQIEAVTRLYNEKAFIYTEDVRIVDQDMLFVDSTFLKVFPVTIISGNDQSLIAPNSVLISQSQARVYFGAANPVGKTMFFNERLPFTITGVFEDIPPTTSIKFDFLLSWSTMWNYGWVSRDGDFNLPPWTFTFVKLKENASDIPAINAALTRMGNEHITTLRNRSHSARYELRPYEQLHTSPELSGEIAPATSKTVLYALLSLALFILIAAWINYINLSLARSLERADEVGVRKIVGATRLEISGQFIVEALVLSVVTFLLGYGVFALIAGPFSNLIFSNINLVLPDARTWLLYFSCFVAGTTIIACYPAQFISRSKPTLVVKSKGVGGRRNVLQQTLLIVQLFLAVSVVGISVIAGRQIQFLREFDSGFSARQTISLRAPASTNSDSLRYSRYTSFREEVLRNHAFRSGTASMNIPGQEIRYHDEAVQTVGTKNEKRQFFWVMWVDEGYQETFGLRLAAGRNFRQREFGKTCMINETAAKALGYASPLDAVNTTLITTDEKAVTIVGVWKDYHHQSLHKTVDPIIFYYHHPHEYGYYSFSVQSREGDYLEALEKIWHRHYPNDQFTSYFMDSFFEDQYRGDELFGKLLRLFSIISILVASLGLVGMTSLAVVKRTREIGVRKVLGASVWNILTMLSATYVKLIAISCVFAFPLAYYLTTEWLKGFAYKIAIAWWMIALPGLLVLIATLFTIGSLSFKAAMANPAKSLRDQ